VEFKRIYCVTFSGLIMKIIPIKNCPGIYNTRAIGRKERETRTLEKL